MARLSSSTARETLTSTTPSACRDISLRLKQKNLARQAALVKRLECQSQSNIHSPLDGAFVSGEGEGEKQEKSPTSRASDN
jgi:hypothetical protein